MTETSRIRTRHTHPVIVVTVIACFSVMLATQGLVVRKATHAANDAAETAATVRDVTDPACDQRRPACKRAQQQSSVVPDLEEVSVIASYCGHVPVNDTLPEVRACVEAEFRRLTGRPPMLTSSTTTTIRR